MTLLSVAVLLGISSPAFAHDQGSWEHKNKYLRDKMEALGASPGCDLVANECEGTKRTGDNVRKYFNTMRRAIAPPSPPPKPVQTSSYQEPAPAQTPAPTGGGTDAIPSYISDCESGGDYNASNPSGAYGKYQIMPQTAAGYGCDLSTPAGQDACAAKIYAAEGAAPWACG